MRRTAVVVLAMAASLCAGCAGSSGPPARTTTAATRTAPVPTPSVPTITGTPPVSSAPQAGGSATPLGTCGYSLAQLTAIVGTGWAFDPDNADPVCAIVKGGYSVAAQRRPVVVAQAEYIRRNLDTTCEAGRYELGARGGTGAAVCSFRFGVKGGAYRDGRYVNVLAVRRGAAALSAADTRFLVAIAKRLVTSG